MRRYHDEWHEKLRLIHKHAPRKTEWEFSLYHVALRGDKCDEAERKKALNGIAQMQKSKLDACMPSASAHAAASFGAGRAMTESEFLASSAGDQQPGGNVTNGQRIAAAREAVVNECDQFRGVLIFQRDTCL